MSRRRVEVDDELVILEQHPPDVPPPVLRRRRMRICATIALGLFFFAAGAFGARHGWRTWEIPAGLLAESEVELITGCFSEREAAVAAGLDPDEASVDEAGELIPDRAACSPENLALWLRSLRNTYREETSNR